MKCKYGDDNMILSKDEFLWHCPHCGYEKFATRSAYNCIKTEAKKAIKSNEITCGNFIEHWNNDLRDMAFRAWGKAWNEILKERANYK